jgi:hypothetical protein
VSDFDIGKNIAFKHALVKYVRHYIDRHGTLKVVCVRMDNPVKLDEIYTAVQLLDRRALGYYDSTESLEELFRQSGRRSFNLFQAEKKGLYRIDYAAAAGKCQLIKQRNLNRSKFLNP